MQQDQRYDVALTAALVILSEMDRLPDMSKPTRLALVVFSILHALNQLDEERGKLNADFSIN